jgi:hypothetical protein
LQRQSRQTFRLDGNSSFLLSGRTWRQSTQLTILLLNVYQQIQPKFILDHFCQMPCVIDNYQGILQVHQNSQKNSFIANYRMHFGVSNITSKFNPFSINYTIWSICGTNADGVKCVFVSIYIFFEKIRLSLARLSPHSKRSM